MASRGWPFKADGSNSKGTGSHHCTCESLMWEEDAWKKRRRHHTVSTRHPITKRQVEMLGLMARGCTQAQIAEVACVSPITVKHILEDVRVKLCVPNNMLALIKAFRLGMLELPSLTEIQDMYGRGADE